MNNLLNKIRRKSNDRTETSDSTEPMVTTGRGGAGNAQPVEQTVTDPTKTNAAQTSEEAEISLAHEKASEQPHEIHTGRGGGNVVMAGGGPGGTGGRRKSEIEEEAIESQKIRMKKMKENGIVHSVGKGGSGNIAPGDGVSCLHGNSWATNRTGHGHCSGRVNSTLINNPTPQEVIAALDAKEDEIISKHSSTGDKYKRTNNAKIMAEMSDDEKRKEAMIMEERRRLREEGRFDKMTKHLKSY